VQPEPPRRKTLDTNEPVVPREDQFAGSLIGQCLGDAVGAPVEGMPPGTCRRYVDLELRADTAGRGRGRFRFGQYTDDSQLARELLISFVERGGFDPADYAARIGTLFGTGRVVGGGRATREAAERLRQGVPWDQAGTPAPAAGNGSAMRAGPVGLLCWEDPEAMVRVAIEQGRITHQDPRCAAGSVAIAGAVSLALRPGEIDPISFVRQLVEWAAPVSPEFGKHLSRLPDWLEGTPEDAAVAISRAGMGGGPPPHGWGGISPFVIGSVLWSLYAFLRTPDDYWETICTAIWAGGDVDSMAAMAGAISGARVGLDALPLQLARRLEDQGEWDYERLVRLARQVHGRQVLARRRGDGVPVQGG
jgi:ADP-ribosylglycohydrolase